VNDIAKGFERLFTTLGRSLNDINYDVFVLGTWCTGKASGFGSRMLQVFWI